VVVPVKVTETVVPRVPDVGAIEVSVGGPVSNTTGELNRASVDESVLPRSAEEVEGRRRV